MAERESWECLPWRTESRRRWWLCSSKHGRSRFFIRTPTATGRGTPQGSAVSPVLANLFLHYAMDSWLEREFPSVEFERYADDAVLHCSTEYQARKVRDALAKRLESLGLRLHPGKTKIVYCRDANRRW